MEKEKYIAYVGTYTHGSSIGIHLYDVDVEEGTLSERKVVPVNNSSYVVNRKTASICIRLQMKVWQCLRSNRMVIWN